VPQIVAQIAWGYNWLAIKTSCNLKTADSVCGISVIMAQSEVVYRLVYNLKPIKKIVQV